MEKRVALCCMFCDGRAKTVLEEDIFRKVIIHAMQTVHGERERRYRQAVDDSLRVRQRKLLPVFAWKETLKTSWTRRWRPRSTKMSHEAQGMQMSILNRRGTQLRAEISRRPLGEIPLAL